MGPAPCKICGIRSAAASKSAASRNFSLEVLHNALDNETPWSKRHTIPTKLLPVQLKIRRNKKHEPKDIWPENSIVAHIGTSSDNQDCL
eukprot:2481995-Amphidinium_carterae.1